MVVKGEHPANESGEIVIVPPRGLPMPRLRETGGNLGLLWFFVLRDVKSRYSQTLLGIGWAVLQPLLTTLIFWAVFGHVIHVPTGRASYPLFALAGLCIWNLFSQGMTGAAGSVLANQNQVTKIYFPRLIIPLAAVAVTLLDFAISLVLLVIVAVATGSGLGGPLLLAPLFVLLAAAVATGVGSALGALNVLYRDVRHLVGFLAQLWLVATPVAYPASLIPDRWRWLAGLNPMAGIVEGFRWSVLGTPAPDMMLLVTSAATSVVVLIVGVMLFSALEDRFADVI
ncbi:ABC transporter permease [Sphingomonas sp.]|uniref:ABC transporter permease n=1 Tax=Sphingomonas sp. TaxID=28214 RepID=UPI0025F9F963|nr:ABC transporter permease [Sphingomonas sp.]MBV9526813.1 ABC transporter permease [Sphingomonas sp.]